MRCPSRGYLAPHGGSTSGPSRVEVEVLHLRAGVPLGTMGPALQSKRLVLFSLDPPALQPLLPRDAHAEDAALLAAPVPRPFPVHDWDALRQMVGAC